MPSQAFTAAAPARSAFAPGLPRAAALHQGASAPCYGMPTPRPTASLTTPSIGSSGDLNFSYFLSLP